MDRSEALTVLLTLAAGHHPSSGQPLSTEDRARDPLVRDALFVAVQHLRQAQERGERASTGRAWSAAEDAALVAAYEVGTSIDDLAPQFERTPGAIKTRLMKLGKLGVTYREGDLPC